jgi:hypothetical protein
MKKDIIKVNRDLPKELVINGIKYIKKEEYN